MSKLSIAEENSKQERILTPKLERYISDYLEISRNKKLYASEDDYLRAEDVAWKRLIKELEK